MPSAALLLAALLAPPADAGAAPDEPGFFRLEERDHAWTLLDPDGQPFVMRGINHYGDGSGMPWDLAEEYGTREAWRRSVRDRTLAWGFTYLAPSIGPTAHDPATRRPGQGLISRTPEWSPAQFAELDAPFVYMLAYPKQYMSGNDLPDVFGEDFAAGVEEVCAAHCAPLAGERDLIGYHLSHNPPWHPRTKSFDAWIASCTRPGSAGLEAWVRLMRRIYGTVERWRATYGVPIERFEDILTLDDPLLGYINAREHLRDREAFMARICERWYATFHAAIRRHDANHLILGDRNTLHLQPLPAWAVRTMKPYVDVLSVNVMGPRAVQLELLEDVTRHWDGPVLIADGGAGVYRGEPRTSGWASRDLAEYEAVYAGQVELARDHPQVIGFGWCGFYETPSPGPRQHGRGGLVDVATGDPLPGRLDVVRRWNAVSEEARAAADGAARE